jgi:hypothetical protein
MTAWDRKLWGIHFQGSLKEPPRLIGAAWDDKARMAPSYYLGEPTRALLFQTRSHARAWCDARHAEYMRYDADHVCRRWRFTPVRVRETVAAIWPAAK